MLKRLVSMLGAGLCFLYGGMTCSADIAYEEAQVDVPPNILFLGDSIASGYGLEGYSKEDRSQCESYANILAEEYEAELPDDCGFAMNNFAIDGQTSSELLDGLVKGKYDEYLTQADCVVVSIGGNDMLGILLELLEKAGINTGDNENAEFSLTSLIWHFSKMEGTIDKRLEEFSENITQIARLINEKSDARLIVQTLYNPLEDFAKIPKVQDMAIEKISALDEIITDRSEYAGAGYTVCDVAAAFEGESYRLTRIADLDIHPNEEGHKTIARALDKTIREDTYTYMKEVEVSAPIEDRSASEKDDNRYRTAAVSAVIVALAVFLALLINTVIRIKNDKK